MHFQNRRRFLQGSLALAGVGLLSGCGFNLTPGPGPAKIRRIGILANGPPLHAVGPVP